MATKKPSTDVAVKKAGGVVSIAEQRAAELASLAGRVAPISGNKVRLKKGEMSFPDGTKTPGPVPVSVVDFVPAHKYYPGKFDPKNPAPPVCFSIGGTLTTMVPSKNSPEPQADTCSACPHNQWEGGSKACKESRILAILPPGNDPETALAILEVSPTGLKHFDAYVVGIGRKNLTPPDVLVDVSLDDNADTDYPSLRFNNVVPNPDADAVWARRVEAKELIMQEPDVSKYVATKAAKPAARRK